jgi:hypothetical protein
MRIFWVLRPAIGGLLIGTGFGQVIAHHNYVVGALLLAAGTGLLVWHFLFPIYRARRKRA